MGPWVRDGDVVEWDKMMGGKKVEGSAWFEEIGVVLHVLLPNLFGWSKDVCRGDCAVVVCSHGIIGQLLG